MAVSKALSIECHGRLGGQFPRSHRLAPAIAEIPSTAAGTPWASFPLSVPVPVPLPLYRASPVCCCGTPRNPPPTAAPPGGPSSLSLRAERGGQESGDGSGLAPFARGPFRCLPPTAAATSSADISPRRHIGREAQSSSSVAAGEDAGRLHLPHRGRAPALLLMSPPGRPQRRCG